MELEQGETLVEHLTELRKRIIYSLYGLVVSFSLCYAFSEQIFNFVRKPIQPFIPQQGLVFTGVMDKFMAHIKLSVIAGLVIAAPFWIYQIWKFIEPALLKNEKKYSSLFIVTGTALFLSGFLFSYYLVLPTAFNFLMKFGGTTDIPMITISEYMSFFILTSFVFGLSFELPLVIIVLVLTGVVDVEFLREKRRYMVVLLAIIAAVITPPDLISMVMVLLPMIGLYEIAILITARLALKQQTNLQDA